MFRIKSPNREKKTGFILDTNLASPKHGSPLRIGFVLLFRTTKKKRKKKMKIYLHSIIIHVKHSIQKRRFFSSIHFILCFGWQFDLPSPARRPYIPIYMPSKRTFRHTDTRCWRSSKQASKKKYCWSSRQADKFTFLLYMRTNSKYTAIPEDLFFRRNEYA